MAKDDIICNLGSKEIHIPAIPGEKLQAFNLFFNTGLDILKKIEENDEILYPFYQLTKFFMPLNENQQLFYKKNIPFEYVTYHGQIVFELIEDSFYFKVFDKTDSIDFSFDFGSNFSLSCLEREMLRFFNSLKNKYRLGSIFDVRAFFFELAMNFNTEPFTTPTRKALKEKAIELYGNEIDQAFAKFAKSLERSGKKCYFKMTVDHHRSFYLYKLVHHYFVFVNDHSQLVIHTFSIHEKEQAQNKFHEMIEDYQRKRVNQKLKEIEV